MKILYRPGTLSILLPTYALKAPHPDNLTVDEHAAFLYNNIIFNVSTQSVSSSQDDPTLWNERRIVGQTALFCMPSGETLFESTGAYSLCGYVAPTKVILHESLAESILWDIHTMAPRRLTSGTVGASRQLPQGIPVGTTLVRFEYDPPVPAVRRGSRSNSSNSMTIGVRYTDENDVTTDSTYDYTSQSPDSTPRTFLGVNGAKIKSLELYVKSSYSVSASLFTPVPIIGWTQNNYVAENSRYFYTHDDLYLGTNLKVGAYAKTMTIEASHKQVEGKLFIPRPTFQQQASVYIPPFRYQADIVMTGNKV